MKSYLTRARNLFPNAFTAGKKKPRRRNVTPLHRTRSLLEPLEDRWLLSGAQVTSILMSPQSQSTPSGFTAPSQIQQAYASRIK